ncbi:MAG TPA: ACP S-malonyltransferase [Gammaproteobacteria bacterium]|nr:ACP S-malonyltransferase [Gammaproteobacteria bacterium]
MKFAVVFPGQGSQSANMLAGLRAESDTVKKTFEQASSVLGYDLWDLIAGNPDNKLDQTEYTQPAMLAAGIAVWRYWQERGLPMPQLLAGHSLGEYTALVAAQSLSFESALRAVQQRGRLMQQAVPPGAGAMAAILGLEDDQVRSVCAAATAGKEIVQAVNFNAPGQVVIAGTATAVAKAMAEATAAGAKRALPLPVSVPSHSSLMKEAATALSAYLRTIEFKASIMPVLHNIDAAPRQSPGAIIDALEAQLYSPVLWVKSVQRMANEGINTILEFGPGKVLAGLCKRIDKNLAITAVDSPEGMEKAVAAVSGTGT